MSSNEEKASRIISAVGRLRAALLDAGLDLPVSINLSSRGQVKHLLHLIPSQCWDQFGPEPPKCPKLMGIELRSPEEYRPKLIDVSGLNQAASQLGLLMIEKNGLDADEKEGRAALLCDMAVIATTAFRVAYKLITEHNEREYNVACPKT